MSTTLCEIFSYDPMSGEFVWLVSRRQHMIGKSAGCLTSTGYIALKIESRRYKAHRVAWLFMTGAWPTKQIDHINRDRSDNRWSNLRQATRSQNKMNSIGRPDATSTFKGVSWDLRRKKWRAQIKVDKKKIWLGRFDTEKSAYNAYCIAAEKYHGEFKRTV